MIYGLSGRQKSGKTTAANILIDQGYKKASFAAALKEYVAEIFQWDIQDLFTQKGKEAVLDDPVRWNEESCRRLSDLVKLNLEVKEEKTLPTRRKALQHIGTEVLRDHDPNFHINEFRNRYSDGGNYVVDDMRFRNEKEVIESMNGVCFYIARPFSWEYSNHASEISLNRSHFGCSNLIMNADSLIAFQLRTKKIFELQESDFSEICDAFLYDNEMSAYWAGFVSANGKLQDRFKLTLGESKLNAGLESFLEGCLEHPLIIDDLKMWNWLPAEVRLPETKYLNSWIRGYQEGGGSDLCLDDFHGLENINPIIVSKGWGAEIWYENSDYCGKKLIVFKDKQCSVHYHVNKSEVFVINKGSIIFEYCKSVGSSDLQMWNTNFASKVLKEGDVIKINPHLMHRFRGVGEFNEILEISSHHEDSDSIRVLKGDVVQGDPTAK